MVRRTPKPPHRPANERGAASAETCRSNPRYPDLCVSLRSRNPLALVAAVREEMRLAGVDRAEIERFTREALESGADPEVAHRTVARWVGHLHLGASPSFRHPPRRSP